MDEYSLNVNKILKELLTSWKKGHRGAAVKKVHMQHDLEERVSGWY